MSRWAGWGWWLAGAIAVTVIGQIKNLKCSYSISLVDHMCRQGESSHLAENCKKNWLNVQADIEVASVMCHSNCHPVGKGCILQIRIYFAKKEYAGSWGTRGPHLFPCLHSSPQEIASYLRCKCSCNSYNEAISTASPPDSECPLLKLGTLYRKMEIWHVFL